mgnify:CR=1 FL=1
MHPKNEKSVKTFKFIVEKSPVRVRDYDSDCMGINMHHTEDY